MFFKNPYEENVRKVYDQYDELINKRRAKLMESPDGKKRLYEMKLFRRHVAQTMLLMDRLPFMLDNERAMRELKAAVAEQEPDWVSRLEQDERMSLFAIAESVTKAESEEERNGLRDVFNEVEDYEFDNYPRVYEDAIRLMYYSLTHYAKVKVGYWKEHPV